MLNVKVDMSCTVLSPISGFRCIVTIMYRFPKAMLGTYQAVNLHLCQTCNHQDAVEEFNKLLSNALRNKRLMHSFGSGGAGDSRSAAHSAGDQYSAAGDSWQHHPAA